MERTFQKQIADPVHGTIDLTPVEVEIISTRSFQRLSRIGQLGLVRLVFPGAQYSRFSHSVGVCHVAGRILDSIAETPGFMKEYDYDEETWNREWQRYRLAALLHDVGHYPFSHTMEHALDATYDALDADGEKQYWEHEAVGAYLVKNDPEIRPILEEAGFDRGEIAAIFQRDHTANVSIDYADVVSSGLDADRLDYLLRSSRFSGVPYGGIDLEYLISQFQVDADNDVCLTEKARLTADHFLLSRWFEYQQMIFHHTVQAADATLEDVLKAAFDACKNGREDLIPSCTRKDVQAMIDDGEWPDFDDNSVFESIRRLRDDTTDNTVRAKCRAVLERRLPKVVYQQQEFRQTQGKRQNPDAEDYRRTVHATLSGRVTGDIDGPIKGEMALSVPNPERGPWTGDVRAEVEGVFSGELEGDVTGILDPDDSASVIQTIKGEIDSIIQDVVSNRDLEVYWRDRSNKMPFTKSARPEDRLSPNGKSPDDHSVRIAGQVRDEASDVTARLIVDDESSVTQLLVGTERHIWRLYILCSADEDGHFPDEETVRDVRTEIEERIQEIVVEDGIE